MICTRLHLGHQSVRVGDSSRGSQEIVIKSQTAPFNTIVIIFIIIIIIITVTIIITTSIIQFEADVERQQVWYVGCMLLTACLKVTCDA